VADEYTPTTGAIRKIYSAAPIVTEANRLGDADVARNVIAFDRWLAAHDAEIRHDQFDKSSRDWADEHAHQLWGGAVSGDGPFTIDEDPRAVIARTHAALSRAASEKSEIAEEMKQRLTAATAYCADTTTGDWRISYHEAVQYLRGILAGQHR